MPDLLTQRAYIGLGANLGDTSATLHAALEALAALPDCALVRASAAMPPWRR
jgi:7,8-dihydro-6-hydroxymethylpterin-pyrophosphokinase